MSLATTLIGLNALVFGAFGVLYSLVPEAASRFATDGAPTTASGLIDLRATYGGMSLAIGAFLAMTARQSELHGLGLRSVAVIMGCMATTRMLGMALDGSPNAIMWVYLGTELLVLGAALWALRAEPARTASVAS